MSPDCGGSVVVMKSFLRMIGVMLDRKRDFELAHAYLALFLKVSLRCETALHSLPSSTVALSDRNICRDGNILYPHFTACGY